MKFWIICIWRRKWSENTKDLILPSNLWKNLLWGLESRTDTKLYEALCWLRWVKISVLIGTGARSLKPYINVVLNLQLQVVALSFSPTSTTCFHFHWPLLKPLKFFDFFHISISSCLWLMVFASCGSFFSPIWITGSLLNSQFSNETGQNPLHCVSWSC